VRVIRVFKNLFHRPVVRFGAIDNSRIATTPIRNSLFVSFITETGCYRARHVDRHESHMRRRKLAKGVMLIGIGALIAWFIIESAKAMTMF
jgi:hypothetical protein